MHCLSANAAATAVFSAVLAVFAIGASFAIFTAGTFSCFRSGNARYCRSPRNREAAQCSNQKKLFHGVSLTVIRPAHRKRARLRIERPAASVAHPASREVPSSR